jgi:hypothetical protein
MGIVFNAVTHAVTITVAVSIATTAVPPPFLLLLL